MSVPVPAEPATPAEAITAARTAFQITAGLPHNWTARTLDHALAAALEAAAPAIRADERQRMFAEGNPDNYHGLIKLTRADTALTERRRLAAEATDPAAIDHARAAIADAEQQLRSLIIGAYGDGRLSEGITDQLGHAAAVLTGTAIDALTRTRAATAARIAVLEQLARDILTTFQGHGCPPYCKIPLTASASHDQARQWEATLKGDGDQAAALDHRA